MRCADHDPFGVTGGTSEFGEDAIEHAQAAPGDEAVVDRLVRTISLGCVAPHQPMLDDVDDR